MSETKIHFIGFLANVDDSLVGWVKCLSLPMWKLCRGRLGPTHNIDDIDEHKLMLEATGQAVESGAGEVKP